MYTPHPWRLLGRAVLWLGLAFFAMVLVLLPAQWPVIVAGFKAGVAHRPVSRVTISPSPALTEVAIFMSYGVMLLGAVRGARWANSLDEGLADRPMQRAGAIVALAVPLVVWLLILAGLRWVARHHGLPTRVVPQMILPAAPVLILLKVAELCLVAPLVEELFFRGWLWTALRRLWGPMGTAFWTGGLFLSMHAQSGVRRLVILLPIAIVLSVARHRGDSVRASLALHMMNNGLVAAEVWLTPLLSSGA